MILYIIKKLVKNLYFKNREISGHTLLMLHNMTTYYEFFEQVRQSIQNDSFEKYKKFVTDQFSKI